MKSFLLPLILSFALLSSAGVSALEVDEEAHQWGEVLGTPSGICCFIIPPYLSRLCLLFCLEPVIVDILSLIMNTMVKYFSLFLITSFYDLVNSVVSSNPERAFDLVSALLSFFKGFFDGAWSPGRLSCWRLCLSPVGKTVNGVLAELSIEDYYKHAELATRGVPARTIDKEP
ncbi:MAG: hypothetical protein SVE93_07085 [Candidatus Thermoplasmatota archaeon]|nr:hypothetical protein [Candidatus Thermoplasmatota archaeon]